VTTLEHPTCSPDLAPADYYIFPRLKLAFKGRRFYDATDVIKNATAELKRFCFQHFLSCWQRCVIVQADYFEVTVA
jgi:hypothetical protein